MKYLATIDTDIGIYKDTNQDSAAIKHANCELGEILMAIICDGMGGLAKGELASATVIRRFLNWFDQELGSDLIKLDINGISRKWVDILKDLNKKILDYSKEEKVSMGTTFTGILFINDLYTIVHVGDSRIYEINSIISQLTTDQTFVAREISRGRMTVEEASIDKRRNMLLQCVGASNKIEPEIIIGQASKGVYLICSDGFRHEVSEQEMLGMLNYDKLIDKDLMHSNAKHLINQAKNRNERDNISVVLIKVN